VSSIKVAHRFCLDGATTPPSSLPRPEGAAPRAWEPDEDAGLLDQLHLGYDSAAQGVQLTHRNCWLNAATFGWHTGVSDRTCCCTLCPCSTAMDGACPTP